MSQGKTSCFKWVHQPYLQCCRHSSEEGTSWYCSKWWKKPRWLHSYSLARGTTFGMRCQSLHHSSCFLLDHGKSYSRRGRWTSYWQEMYWTVFHSWVSASGSWVTLALSESTASFLKELGRKITDHSGKPLERGPVSLAKSQHAGAMFQCYFISRNFQPFQPAFMFLTFLLLTFKPQDPYYWGYLKNKK